MCIKDIGSEKTENVIGFISNDYLGMSKREETIQAGIEALKKYGTGVCAAGIIGGYSDIHKQLEEELADFVGKEDALVFSSGFGANVGILNALLGKNDIALVDSFVHTSVLDGLKGTNIKNIGHNNLEYLEFTLQKVKNLYTTKLVIVDGIYSQDGDIALLPGIIQVCKRHGALLMVDDAHGIGTFGSGGKGVAEYYNVIDDIDIITGTLSKSFGCVGGFAASSQKIIQYLRYYAGTAVFSAAPTPQVIASSLKALELMKTKPEIREKLWDNVAYLRNRLDQEGFDYGKTVSPIFPIMVRDDFKVKLTSALLKERGIYAIGICYPAVSSKEARIRASVLSTHSFSQLDTLVDALCDIDRLIKIKK